ncbi:NFACT family protein [Clostridium sp. 'deep sea']|uniref:Rqc2 family fibronectin-binding protein n=1 Tax=Clostridium sp. 'deep sea' TaxID=2779445 RepID=UPI001896808C|nr:NFACT RNA binding domain-containing protein [Clostridium sp. 'deep sea']QOR36198.1 NFACT family protein [Clostridium sp. 'deep sea']
MAMDGLTLRAIVDELQTALVGGKVQKSQQPKKDEIILNIYNNKNNYKLLINSNAENYRINLTKHSYENPKQAPLFCMLLRKHIDSGKITKIEQPGLERVVKIFISSRDELGNPVEKVLICELMGKHSNLILANAETHKIIDAVKRVPFGVSRVRQILPGFSYTKPPTTKKSILNDMVELSSSNFASSLVDSFTGISPLIARELAHRYNDYYEAIAFIKDIIAEKNYEPSITKSKLGKMWCGVLPYTHLASDFESYSNMNNAMDEFYYIKTTTKQFNSYKQDLLKVCNKSLSKNKRTLEKQLKDLKGAEKAEKYKHTADLIKANLYQIKGGLERVEVIDYFDPELKPIIIKLDPHKSPNKNLTSLYKKYEKAIRTKENLTSRVTKNRLEIDYLESIITLINTSLVLTDLEQIKLELIEEGYIEPPKQKKGKKPKKQEVKVSQPRQYLSADGFIIEVGRNNRQNDHLSLKKAHKEDIWFHTKDIPGSHVVIRSKGAEVSENTLLLAANLAAFFSKAKSSANVPVDYTTVKRVFKQRGAHPGQVLYTHQRTLYVTPNEKLIPEEVVK